MVSCDTLTGHSRIFGRLDINPIIDDMIDFYLPQAAAHSITLRKSLHKEPLICLTDAGMLKQAIFNLFINAQQAIGGQGELMVQTQRDGQNAEIQISDTGKGIPAERLVASLSHINPRGPTARDWVLATVKKIIDAHKGTINVVSELGKGQLSQSNFPFQLGGA